ncbi:MAG: hypothetical protein V7K47_14185 [Nostoc sp.]
MSQGQRKTRETLPPGNDSLNGDVILDAQAIFQLKNFDEVIVVTTNLKHISLFKNEGIFVADWQQTINNIV